MKQGKVIGNSIKGAVSLLRICTVLLAVVSFWATAQGMANYVFHAKWQAYAASLAIQGILLGLNFYFPAFWNRIKSKDAKGGLLTLTAIVVFCSSWFSFIFIVEQVYGQSWEIESRLLIQSVYRRQLYLAEDYADKYKGILADDLNQQIIDLYSQAKSLSAGETNPIDDMNWDEERMVYTTDDFAARNEMKAIIDAMESASRENASPNERERAIEIVMEMRVGIENTSEQLQGQVERTNGYLDAANSTLQESQRNLNAASPETDRTPLITAVELAQQNLEKRQSELQELQGRLSDYQEAMVRVQFYEISLGLISEGSADLISASLRNIQQELFHDSPDLDSLESQAANIFQLLQSAVDVSVNEGKEYLTLLNEMNQFINDLKDYKVISSIVENFDDLIEKLGNDAEDFIDGKENWKSEWSQRLNVLKSQIALLPTYNNAENSEMQNYDRAQASDELDDMIRLYIADHNAAQQGIIYLSSPYRGMAIFSIILAFFLDIAAFVTGLLIEVINQWEEQKKDVDEENEIEEEEKVKYAYENIDVPELNHYLYINGEYVHEAGENTYRAIEHGQEIEVSLPDIGLKAGLYVEQDGNLKPISDTKELQLVTNPQDGIYKNCCIRYEDHALSVAEDFDKEYRYLTSVSDRIPVYVLENNHLEITTSGFLNNSKAAVIVIALNQKGTEVIAIYMCDKVIESAFHLNNE